MSPSLATLKRLLAVLIAVGIVVAAGTVVGQAPELFGADVAEDPAASIEMADQTGDGDRATVDTVNLSEGGFVVVADSEGQILAVSDYLEAGDHANVTVERPEDGPELLGQLRATVHRDTNDDGEFDYEETDGEEDGPFVEDGYPVADTATVTSDDEEDEGQGTNGSFTVESVDAPQRVTVDEPLNVTAEIRNPNEFETRQHVEFRLDGTVHERRVLGLEPEETRDVAFEIDVGGVDPGTYAYGIYTTEDGSVGEITIETAQTASVSIVAVRNDSVVADATLPDGGFLALENGTVANDTVDNDTVENGTDAILATSEDLEPGEHENVTLEYEELDADDANLTVVAYRGDAADLENATAYDVDGERVAAPLSTANDSATDDGVGSNGEGDDSSDDGSGANGDGETDGADADDEGGDEASLRAEHPAVTGTGGIVANALE